MTDILQHPYAQAFARALVHFVWQGAGIGLVVFALTRFSGLSAFARYAVGVGALVAMLVAPAVTFAMLAGQSAAEPQRAALFSAGGGQVIGRDPAATSEPIAPVAEANPAATRAAPFGPSAAILALWCSGVVLFSLRLLGGWLVARRVALRAIEPAAQEIQTLACRLSDQLGLDRVVRVVVSSAVAVPVMIGWLKPVVLLPMAALSGLTMDQVEAVLAHELAHVRRHDYLVNLLQSVVETLLFYHPAVWWVSRSVRTDREHCCDDVTLGVCDRMVYATALTELATMTAPPRVALAVTDGSLVNRVRRILGRPVVDRQPVSGWLGALVVLLVVGSIAAGSLASARASGSAPAIAPVSLAQTPAVVAQSSSSPVAVAVTVPSGQGQSQTQSQTQARADEVRRLQQEVEARMRKIQEERSRIDEQRSKNEFEKAQTQSEAKLEALMAELEAVRKQYEQTKTKVAVGLANTAALTDLQARIQILEQKIRAEEADIAFLFSDLELRQREGALARETLASDEAQVKLQRLVEQQQLETNIKKMAEIQDLARVGAESMPAAAADARVQVRDVLTIVISGEPDLPRAYVVQADGSIRFPLVGSIQVLGLTARQVHEAIGKQLLDRHLAAGAVMDVTLRRPRSDRE